MVVQSAMGLDVATDANYNYFSTTTSASPGQTIILWGSGVGADPNNDDRTYPLNQDNLTNIPMTVYIGRISANIAYRGRSQFPGVDQIVVTIPTWTGRATTAIPSPAERSLEECFALARLQ
jgi:uncharacterized protein (TIGR03437 family)